MEKLTSFIARLPKKVENTYPVREGGTKTESELIDEYNKCSNETKTMVSFEGYCGLRKNMRQT